MLTHGYSPNIKLNNLSPPYQSNHIKKSSSPQQPSPYKKPNVNISITYNTNYNISLGHHPSFHHENDTSSTSSPTKSRFNPSLLISRDTLRFCLFCTCWYASSALTNNTGKQILNQFKYPVTLTFIQFGFVASLSLVWTALARTSKIVSPSWPVISTVLPLAVFQIAGHIFSSMAISRVPVSFAHTIKALSPLFTVLFYRALYQIIYAPKVYISLLPLTFGVMLVCISELKFNFIGFLCALISTLIFVTQNIFSKKLFSGGPASKGLDKINLLFYSSGLAFILMGPLWAYSDGLILFASNSPTRTFPSPSAPSTHLTLPFLFLLNGTTHFFQNILAFHILSLVSPVTYSIASLIKRIFVICASILWFGQVVDARQGVGILLTFFGLWVYQDAKRDVGKGEERLNTKDRYTLPLRR